MLSNTLLINTKKLVITSINQHLLLTKKTTITTISAIKILVILVY